MVTRAQFLVILTILLSSSAFVYGQGHVKVNINLSGIDKEKLVVHFDDGVILDVLDLTQGDSTIIVDKEIHTLYPTFSVVYDRKYYKKFFVDSNIAVLNLYFDESKTADPFYYDGSTNVTAIYDTVSNEIYSSLKRGQIAEVLKLNDLFTKHGHEIRTNDSVKYELTNIVKVINAKSMDYLAPYANDFFSFYYFKDQVLTLASLIENDSEYYSKLLAYYNNTFPEEFRNTGEGKQIIARLQQKISPVLLQENEIMPDIHIKDINGVAIHLKDPKEHFVLLDFWASWCTPCLQQIPDIKALRNQFSTDELKIVSISIDKDSTSFLNSIKEHRMDWVHSLDRSSSLSDSLGISSIPTLLLVDQNGKIVYYKNGGKLDMDRIRAIVRAN
ncbi:hypothetical protein KO02_15735 [Sphingobacterium sp. ML3W]|uniref:TlpA family protein disulfide reductase n=1 Tax=Sphingobacterium sp. ML3W TaxID=1538644 RepID=UPI0004F63381|nr:TlpA disulfide reductase family protein [Sphingobacterium sp. ML3W]AIM37975.1 hypothetical protein KO02_15735 [Sphingobacterium sp. ML3W]